MMNLHLGRKEQRQTWMGQILFREQVISGRSCSGFSSTAIFKINLIIKHRLVRCVFALVHTWVPWYLCGRQRTILASRISLSTAGCGA